MEWMSSVCSLRFHRKKTAPSTMSQNNEVTPYGIPNARCIVSDTPVPAVAIARARYQYDHAL